jgi:hypothetical protein
MKIASFKYTGTPNTYRVVTVYGTVTQKDNGKISISLHCAKEYSYAAKYAAKKLAIEIVASGFVHPAITSLEIKEAGNDVLANLYERTADLKVKWIERVHAYVNNTWPTLVRDNDRTFFDWCEAFNVPMRKDKNGNDVGHNYNTKQYASMERRRNQVRDLVNKGKAAYLADELKDAEEHYIACVEKLAYRLAEKGLKSVADLKVKSGWVGQNLEMIFEFNGIIVHARTITAEGPIQRAHYRYLVN